MKTPLTSRIASYPVVPDTGQSPGSGSPGSRIFSTVIHWSGAMARSRSRYSAGSTRPSGWSIRRPLMPAATQSFTRAWVASKTSGFSTRRPASVATAKKRR